MLPYRVLLQFGTQVKLRYDAFLLAQTSCYAAVPFSCTSLLHLGTDVMLRYGAFLLHFRTRVMLHQCAFLLHFGTDVMLRFRAFLLHFRTRVMLR